MTKKVFKKIPLKAKKRVRRLNQIKPSKLPKNTVATIRINSIAKDHLIAEGLTIQELFDLALDKKLDHLEFEKETVIKTNGRKVN